MPRIGTPREPGHASTPRQLARNAAILHAARRLGALHGLERVQMSDVAAEAGVALGTLYRYYPSKHHLFAATLSASVAALPPPTGTPDDPVAAVRDFLGTAAADLLAEPHLARLGRERALLHGRERRDELDRRPADVEEAEDRAPCLRHRERDSDRDEDERDRDHEQAPPARPSRLDRLESQLERRRLGPLDLRRESVQHTLELSHTAPSGARARAPSAT